MWREKKLACGFDPCLNGGIQTNTTQANGNIVSLMPQISNSILALLHVTADTHAGKEPHALGWI